MTDLADLADRATTTGEPRLSSVLFKEDAASLKRKDMRSPPLVYFQRDNHILNLP